MAEVPYVTASRTPSGIVVAKCPFCEKSHNHGRDMGRRAALCGKGEYHVVIQPEAAPLTKPETPKAKRKFRA